MTLLRTPAGRSIPARFAAAAWLLALTLTAALLPPDAAAQARRSSTPVRSTECFLRSAIRGPPTV